MPKIIMNGGCGIMLKKISSIFFDVIIIFAILIIYITYKDAISLFNNAENGVAH